MLDPQDIYGEFDPETRIVHLTAHRTVRAMTIEEGLIMARRIKEILSEYLSIERGYLITDYSKIVVDPKMIDMYSREIKYYFARFLYPGGIARYGLGLTRVTARAGHAGSIGGKPNLFNSKEEAFTCIHNLIKQNKGADPSDANLEAENIEAEPKSSMLSELIPEPEFPTSGQS